MNLANEDDPFIDGSGKLIEPAKTPDIEISNSIEKRKVLPLLSSLQMHKKVSADNLPEPDKQQQTVICAVVSLKLLGVSDVDIAEITKTSLNQIQSIVRKPAAQQTFEKIYQNLISINSTTVQGRIAAHADRAVDVVLDMMENVDVRDDVRLKAAQDILDRSGTNPDQFFAETVANNQSNDELRIVIMDESGERERVKVDFKRGS
jgi:hypothetical protein